MSNCTKEESAQLVEKYWKREWDKIRQIEFPVTREHPITEKELLSEIKSLKKESKSSRSNSRIVKYFHKSMILANKGGYDSPYEYWQKLKEDPELFKKFYENRLRQSDWFKEKNGKNNDQLWIGNVPEFIYGIGLTTSMKAPQVSYFKPGYAKHLIETYLNEYDTIVDTFAGYSGRLLGAACTGKNYIGFDLNDATVEESNKVIEFLKSNDADIAKLNLYVDVKDTLSGSGNYENYGYLSCPPYSGANGKQIEYWEKKDGSKIECTMTCDEIIDYTLRNYVCAKYVFVVDGSSCNYDKYVTETLVNDSYIQARESNDHKPKQNVEKVIVIDKASRDELIG